MDRSKYLLYLDDTGNRSPGTIFRQPEVRSDGMNCFGLGGMLVKEESVEELHRRHTEFCSQWQIDYPLHSSRIRGSQGRFGWLKNPNKKEEFLAALQEFVLSLPIIGIACVVHRPGYLARYSAKYDGRVWDMCKTTYCILVERAAKFADVEGRNLEVYFERCGKMEDRNIVEYARDLKRYGNPFSEDASRGYRPLSAEDYRRVVLGEPHRMTKESPLLQIADLVLYPMAKGGYDSDYRPYRKLKEAGKLIDCLVAEEEVSIRGIKYSCFDGLQQ